MRLLITSSRMPFALDAIRKLGERGHEVFAADSYAASPGSHRSTWPDTSPASPPPIRTDSRVTSSGSRGRTRSRSCSRCSRRPSTSRRNTGGSRRSPGCTRRRSERWPRCTTRGASRSSATGSRSNAADRARPQRGGAAGGDPAVPPVLRQGGVLARGSRPAHPHRAAGRPPLAGRLPSDRGESLAGPGVRGWADALHLPALHDGRVASHGLLGAAAVGALDRDPVPLRRSVGHARNRRAARLRALVDGQMRSTSSRRTRRW